MMSLDFGGKGLVISHYGERGNFSNKSVLMEFDTAGVGKSMSLLVLSKDMLPLLTALADLEIVGKITIVVTESCVAFGYATELADYKVHVPSCALNGKRNKTAFEAYGE
jgi:hypothetical protein